MTEALKEGIQKYSIISNENFSIISLVMIFIISLVIVWLNWKRFFNGNRKIYK